MTLFFIYKTNAQTAVSIFQDAYSKYENGEYDKSLNLLKDVETKLGSTNSKIQSLRVSIYQEMGNEHNTLIELEKYLAVTKNTASSEYKELKTIYDRLVEEKKKKYQSSLETIEQQKQYELNKVKEESSLEKDSFYCKVAQETNTIETYELFLKKCNNNSLKLLAAKTLEDLKDRKQWHELIYSGLAYLKDENYGKAKELFLSAQKISDLKWLREQIEECDNLYLRLLLNSGIEDYFNKDWDNAIKKIVYVYQQNRSNKEAEEYLINAEDQRDFRNAYKLNSPIFMLKYHRDYPNGIYKNQASAFLYEYYLTQFKSNLAGQNYRAAKQSEEKVLEMANSNLGFWEDIYSKYFWELHKQYKELLFSKGQMYYKSKKYEEAEYALKEFAEGMSDDNRITRANKLLKKIYKIWNRRNFAGLTISYEDKNKYCIGFEVLNKKKLGFYLQVRKNFGQLDLNTLSDMRIPVSSQQIMFDDEPQRARVDESLSLFMGTSIKLFHPLWLTLGCGAGGYKEYKVFAYSGKLLNIQNPTSNTDNYLVYPQIGLDIKLSNYFILKYNAIYSERTDNKLMHQFGIGFSFSKN